MLINSWLSPRFHWYSALIGAVLWSLVAVIGGTPARAESGETRLKGGPHWQLSQVDLKPHSR